MKKSILFILLFITGLSFSQNINNYKYIIVSEKFDFQRSEHEYNLNNLVRAMFQKYGFEVYYLKAQLPQDVALDKCKALFADVQKVPGFLSTNVTIALKDCSGNTLFTSQVGKSKEKDYRRAYNEALRKASVSLDGLNYKYSGENLNNAKEDLNVMPVVDNQASVASFQQQLFAQPISNGYQLIDSAPKVILRIYKTSNPDSYTAIFEGKNGILFKKDNSWILEYYDNEQLISHNLNIKF